MGETFKRTIPHVTTLSDYQKADQRENGILPRELCYHTMCYPTQLNVSFLPSIIECMTILL